MSNNPWQLVSISNNKKEFYGDEEHRYNFKFRIPIRKYQLNEFKIVDMEDNIVENLKQFEGNFIYIDIDIDNEDAFNIVRNIMNYRQSTTKKFFRLLWSVQKAITYKITSHKIGVKNRHDSNDHLKEFYKKLVFGHIMEFVKCLDVKEKNELNHTLKKEIFKDI